MLPRLVLIDRAQGQADVDEHVVADPDLGHMLEADSLGYPAEVDLAHQQVVLAVGLRYFSRDRSTSVFPRGGRGSGLSRSQAAGISPPPPHPLTLIHRRRDCKLSEWTTP